MLTRLRGILGGSDDDGTLCVFVGGVGYGVKVSDRDRDLFGFKGIGGEVELWLREHYSEGKPPVLIGFASPDDRFVFDRLCDVDGIGPMTALRVLSVFTREALAAAGKDPAAFAQIPGIGPKLSAKIAEKLKLETAVKIAKPKKPKKPKPAAGAT